MSGDDPRLSLGLADFAEHFHGKPLPWLHRRLADRLAETEAGRIRLMLRPRQPRYVIGAAPPTRRAFVIIDDMEVSDG